MDLNSILMFERVVKTGSFSRAAQELAVTKSTISKKVSELEADLGATLLRRTTRSLQLTDMGRQFLEQCSRALTEIREATDAAQASSAEARGNLRITAPADFATSLVAPKLAGFLERYPNITIEMVLSDSILNLVTDNIDVALRIGRLQDSSLRARKIGRDIFQLCASASYLKNAPPLREPADLRHHKCLIFAPKSDMATWNLKSDSARFTITPTPRFTANNVYAVRALVATGAGVSLLPVSNLQRDIKEGNLQIVLPKWSMEDAPIHLIYQKLAFTPPKVQVFIDYMEKALKPHFT